MKPVGEMSAQERKDAPVYSGVLKYFPDAIIAVAQLSKVGNDQHNPGQPLHWAREKSTDHGDCIVRHQIDAGTLDTDGIRHSAKVAWRALAQLQVEIEASRAKVADVEADLEEIRARRKAVLEQLKGMVTLPAPRKPNTDPLLSAQPCGCDEAARYTCDFHFTEAAVNGPRRG
jgi:hypothetical protein